MTVGHMLEQDPGIRPPSRMEYDEAQRKIAGATKRDVERALGAERIGLDELCALLSPAADSFLEVMAVRAKALTDARFGLTIGIYAPLYVSNHCSNRCLYCGFNAGNDIVRRSLALTEVAAEAEALARLGHRSVLLVSGDSERFSPLPYLVDCTRVLAERFRTVHVEVASQTTEGYRRLSDAGADGVTIYQETYDPDRYGEYHVAGPKRDYAFRFGAPLRALRSGMRNVTIGPLLGLGPFETELYWGARHLLSLRNADPAAELGFSFPRMRPHAGGEFHYRSVSDRELVRGMLAIRLFAPWAGISVSTRESAAFRDSLTGLVATRLSAASRTTVGGYAATGDAVTEAGQFDIDDDRTVEEVVAMIRVKGRQPIAGDWDLRFDVGEGRGMSA